jgi:hypothetical protein
MVRKRGLGDGETLEHFTGTLLFFGEQQDNLQAVSIAESLTYKHILCDVHDDLSY